MLVNNAYANLAKILANSAVSSSKFSSSSRVEYYSVLQITTPVIFESSRVILEYYSFTIFNK